MLVKGAPGKYMYTIFDVPYIDRSELSVWQLLRGDDHGQHKSSGGAQTHNGNKWYKWLHEKYKSTQIVVHVGYDLQHRRGLW